MTVPWFVLRTLLGDRLHSLRRVFIIFSYQPDVMIGNDGRPSQKGSGSKMTPEAARRIQSHADKTGTNQDFKARAMSAAEKNKKWKLEWAHGATRAAGQGRGRDPVPEGREAGRWAQTEAFRKNLENAINSHNECLRRAKAEFLDPNVRFASFRGLLYQSNSSFSTIHLRLHVPWPFLMFAWLEWTMIHSDPRSSRIPSPNHWCESSFRNINTQSRDIP